jgi:hypothetical protein
MSRKIWPMLFALFTAVGLAAMPASAQPKPNILFIMGDDKAARPAAMPPSRACIRCARA